MVKKKIESAYLPNNTHDPSVKHVVQLDNLGQTEIRGNIEKRFRLDIYRILLSVTVVDPSVLLIRKDEVLLQIRKAYLHAKRGLGLMHPLGRRWTLREKKERLKIRQAYEDACKIVEKKCQSKQLTIAKNNLEKKRAKTKAPRQDIQNILNQTGNKINPTFFAPSSNNNEFDDSYYPSANEIGKGGRHKNKTEIEHPEQLYEMMLSPHDIKWDNVTLGDGFKADIIIHGYSWAGTIDNRVIRYLTYVQKDFFALIANLTSKHYSRRSKKLKNPLLSVKTTVKPGSTNIILDYTTACMELIKMWPVAAQIAIVGGALVGIFGLITYQSKNAKAIKLAEIAERKHAIDALKDISQEALNLLSQSARAPRQLIKMLDDNDSVTINGRPIDKKEAKMSIATYENSDETK